MDWVPGCPPENVNHESRGGGLPKPYQSLFFCFAPYDFWVTFGWILLDFHSNKRLWLRPKFEAEDPPIWAIRQNTGHGPHSKVFFLLLFINLSTWVHKLYITLLGCVMGSLICFGFRWTTFYNPIFEWTKVTASQQISVTSHRIIPFLIPDLTLMLKHVETTTILEVKENQLMGPVKHDGKVYGERDFSDNLLCWICCYIMLYPSIGLKNNSHLSLQLEVKTFKKKQGFYRVDLKTTQFSAPQTLL